MKLIYVGVSDAVDVVDAGIVAERDVPVEIEHDVAMRLLEQRENWAKAPETKTDAKGGTK